MKRIREDTQTSRKNTRLVERVQTTDATETIGFSIALGENRQSFGTFRVTAVKSDWTEMATFKIEAAFRRATGGDVTRISNPQISVQNDWSNPVNTKPTCDVVAAPARQTIEVVLTGRAATTINWYIEIESVQNLT